MRRKYRTRLLLKKWDRIMQDTAKLQESIKLQTGEVKFIEKLKTVSHFIEDLRILIDKNYKRELTRIIDKLIKKDEKSGKCYYHGRYFCHNNMCIEHENNEKKERNERKE